MHHLVEGRCVLQGCGRSFRYDPADLAKSTYPFCSPRCRGVDLGNWVTETYRVEAPPERRPTEVRPPVVDEDEFEDLGDA